MTQKKQWLLFGAILGVACVGTWALVRYAGLGAPPPVNPVGPMVINPNSPNRGNAGQPAPNPATPPNPNTNTPPTPGQAALPSFMSNRGGAAPGGVRGGARGGGGTGTDGGARLPVFENAPVGGGGAAPAGGGGGEAAPAGGARLPFAPNNAVATLTPTDNRPPAGGAALPSFGTSVINSGSADSADNTAPSGQSSGLIQGAALVPPFMIDQSDPNAIARHYLKQLCGERVPTLADWQKLIDMKLPDADKWLKAPTGGGHFVMAMCLDKQNNLWVGEEAGDNSGGLYRFSPADGMWRHFTAKDGLGDDSIYALATDQQGRVWAGTLNHGVSVWNGERFQLYEVVAGLSRPDSLNGPLGEHVVKIAVAPDYWSLPIDQTPVFQDSLTEKDSPMSGSVWMASSAGIAIYFPSTDTWSYLTRADGLPSDQANAIAFDNEGRVFIGHQCDGISIGTPADHYATWQQVTAANPTPHPVDGKLVDTPVPTVGKGPGLPTDLINDLLVAKDGTVYAATTLGLAWSIDHGRSWQYVRGADWIDKVKNRFGGPPKGWQAPTDADKGGGILAEDYTTTLSEDQDGNLLVGHQGSAADILAPRANKNLNLLANKYVTSFVPKSGTKNLFWGTYGNGMANLPAAGVPLVPTMVAKDRAALPAGAKALDLVGLNTLGSRLFAAVSIPPGPRSRAAALAPDWRTQGDWLGRKGRYWACLCGDHSPSSLFWGAGWEDVHYDAHLGQPVGTNESMRNWIQWFYTDDRRALELPPPDARRGVREAATDLAHGRRHGEWDDHGEAYPRSQEGPDLHVEIVIPPGSFMVSIYNFNVTGHDGAWAFRDFDVWFNTRNQYEPYDRAKSVTRERVRDFCGGGCWTQWLVQGPQYLVVYLRRNYSFNTNVNAVMVDLVDEQPPPYFESADSWTARLVRNQPLTSDVVLFQPADTSREASRGILQMLAHFRTRDVTLVAHWTPLVAAMLLRALQPELSQDLPRDSAGRQLLRDCGTCAYWLGLYPQWEATQERCGLVTARAMELLLRSCERDKSEDTTRNAKVAYRLVDCLRDAAQTP